jgi:hypothetical protein
LVDGKIDFVMRMSEISRKYFAAKEFFPFSSCLSRIQSSKVTQDEFSLKIVNLISISIEYLFPSTRRAASEAETKCKHDDDHRLITQPAKESHTSLIK